MDAKTLPQNEPKSDVINSLVAALYTGRYPFVIRAVYHSPVPLSPDQVLEAVRKAYSNKYGYPVSESTIRQQAIDNIIDDLVRSRILSRAEDGVSLPQVVRTYLSESVASFQNATDR